MERADETIQMLPQLATLLLEAGGNVLSCDKVLTRTMLLNLLHLDF